MYILYNNSASIYGRRWTSELHEIKDAEKVVGCILRIKNRIYTYTTIWRPYIDVLLLMDARMIQNRQLRDVKMVSGYI